ncbi:MAG: peptidylprolyl isomerase [Vicinamibacteraceae bacterium]
MKMLKCLAILGALTVSLVLPLQAEILEQILVKVNGEIVTKTELERRTAEALEQRLREKSLSTADLDDAAFKKAVAEITPQVVLNTIDTMLLLQRGRELGIKLTDERFNEVVANIRKENKLESDEEWKTALKQSGLTLQTLRGQLERQMIVQRLQQQEVYSRVSISEEEARAYYKAHRNNFRQEETVTLREVLVALPKATEGKPTDPKAVQGAQRKLEKVQARLKAGEDFAKLAGEISDAPSRANAGLIGPLATRELSANHQKLLAKLKPGQASEPVETNEGWQIIKLESRTPEKVTSFEDAREQINQKVFETKQGGEFQKYLGRLRRQAIIEWKNGEVKKAYDQAVAAAEKQGQQPKPQQSATKS